MRIDDHRVSKFQPLVKVSDTLVQNTGQTVGAVDVKPDIPLPGYLANGFDRIDGTGVGGARVGDDRRDDDHEQRGAEVTRERATHEPLAHGHVERQNGQDAE